MGGAGLKGSLIPQNRRKNRLHPRIFGAVGAENLGKNWPFLAQKMTFLDENDNFCENFRSSYSFDTFLTAWL